jgi:hypothetical protein
VGDAVFLGKRDQRLGYVFMLQLNYQTAHFLCRFEGIGDLPLERGVVPLIELELELELVLGL